MIDLLYNLFKGNAMKDLKSLKNRFRFKVSKKEKKRQTNNNQKKNP